MLLNLVISSFRWIKNENFLFGEKNHIVGKNGSGKTHILDAIHLLTGAKNIYGNARLDSHDRIEVFFGENFSEKSYIFYNDGNKDIFMSHGKKMTRPKYLEALPFRTVYVSPFDMNILYFAPGMRRDYLDDILTRAYAQFSKVKKDYEIVMRQRNALLKKIKEGLAKSEDLDFWDKKFAEIAYQYGLYRERYMRYIGEKIPQFPEFFSSYQVFVEYEWEWISSENPENFIREYLKKNRERDIFSGHTHIGPHRDDFMLFTKNPTLEKQSVQFFLSRGEMKMLLLWLKVIECDFLATQTQKSILLLVDDIFAELDEENIIIFLNTIIQHQIILTSQKPLPEAINHKKFTCINLINS